MSQKVALLQMNSGVDPIVNGETVADAAEQASGAGAVMLFAPEMSAILDRNRTRAASQIVSEDENPFIARVRKAARDNAIWLHLGSLPVLSGASGSKWRNRSLVIDSQGAIRARYDKIHLFDVDLPNGERWRESAAYEPGETAAITSTPIGLLGLTICYDLRFAALFDALGSAGADVIAVPSAFTVPTGEAHWHTLLRARAIEQGCYIIAPAQTGHHEDGRSTYGHSLVVNPWGEVILDMGCSPGLGFASLDLDMVQAVRKRIAAIRHRRPLPAVETK
ncbi:carbon-nitrogen hydrolase family protein [Sphingomonas lacunae]|uniref:Carbon-nitrogen hydrolase family protein n=1 Tax=Sphingomonas lacunae TaxID=2698828 RepID=A0A6M4AWP5_9SPHN|nr:carbon-nitrogen hydrolase family protein [Sphingomonas lacunae]QJQ33176.1 carbon-nitrogen hydrolase family protein [Sphingomonas lacunae]